MEFDHKVKYNGKWYLPGEKIEETAKPTIDDAVLPFEPKFTKTEINRMSTDDLRALAKDSGLKDANSMTGTALKEYLIGLFGL